jgi:hypothetical protein
MLAILEEMAGREDAVFVLVLVKSARRVELLNRGQDLRALVPVFLGYPLSVGFFIAGVGSVAASFAKLGSDKLQWLGTVVTATFMPLSSVAVATAPSSRVVSGFGFFVFEYVISVCPNRIFAICPSIRDFH